MISNALEPISDYLRGEDIHDLRAQQDEGILGFAVVSFILAAIHAFNTYAALWGYMSMAIFFIVHVCLVLVAAVYANIRMASGTDVRYPLMLALTTVFTGVFGAVGCFVSVLMHAFYNRYALPFRQWFETIFPSNKYTAAEDIYEDILTGRDESARDYSVIPFLDVMATGSESQKREALSRMTAHFHPSFAVAFRRALSDDSNAIRVQAATSIAKIENQFLEQTIQVESLHRRFPKDDRIQLALARHYDDYAYTGILDPEREAANRLKALEAYHAYLKDHANDPAVIAQVGRLLIRGGKSEEGTAWLRDAINRGYSTPQMITWYVEGLYKLGQFDELRDFASRFQHVASDQALQPAIAESLRLWAEQRSPRSAA